MNELFQIFENVIERIGRKQLNSSVFQETPVILSLSGGKDSTLVLAFYSYLRSCFGLKSLSAFYLDHSIRETETEISILQKQSTHFQTQLTIFKTDIPKLSLKLKKSWEETGRFVRYQKLKKLLHKLGLKGYVATGHHTEDYLESVLLHLTRGGGPKSFQTLPFFSTHPVPRFLPLVFFTDKELLKSREILESLIPFSQDETNFSDQFKRNRIRKMVTPHLTKEGLAPYTLYWNFQKETELRFWDWMQEPLHPTKPGFITIPRSTWHQTERLQKKQLIDLHLEILKKKPITRGNFQELERQIEFGAETAQRELPDCSIYCQKTGDIWIVAKDSSIWREITLVKNENHVEFEWSNRKVKWQCNLTEKYNFRLAHKDDWIFVNKQKVSFYEFLRGKKIPMPLRSRIPVLVEENQVLKFAFFNET